MRLKKILTADNSALTEIAGWIEKNKRVLRSSASEREFYAIRIQQRLNQVRRQYQDFLKDHPDHAKARIAYGSFLKHLDDRKGALSQWQKALASDPGNAAALNNIATHLGTVAIQRKVRTKIPEAFGLYQKAIALAPGEALYRHNYATALCAFRPEAVRHYKISAREVTERALRQLKTGMELAPDNFEIAADRAETLLEVKPLPRQAALAAWKEARQRAKEPRQRDWVNLHESIVHLETGDLVSAEKTLDLVSQGSHLQLVLKLRDALARERKKRQAKP